MNAIFKLDITRTGGLTLADSIENHIRMLIISGALKSGDAIPTVRELADQWPASYVVIQKALHRCADAGLLVRHTGRKCTVADMENKNHRPGSVHFVIEQTEAEARESDKGTAAYFIKFLSGMQSVLAGNGIVVSASTVAGRLQQNNFIKKIKNNFGDIIVLMRSQDDKFADELLRSGKKLVLVEPHKDYERGIIIRHDEKRAAQDLIAAFIKSGCGRLACVYYDDGKLITSKRLESIDAAMRAGRLHVFHEWRMKVSKRSADSISVSIKKIFDGRIKPDGMIVLNIHSSLVKLALNQANQDGCPEIKIGLYTDEDSLEPGSFAVIVDAFEFGEKTGDFIYNNCFINVDEGLDKILIIPYKFKT